MLRIAFYGKGGIGKSTLASNVSVAFAKMGKKVLHIGCDPKSDSTRFFLNKRQRTVLEILEEKGEIKREEIVLEGKFGISCIETGGPKAGVGCAGLGISTTMKELEKIGILEEDWDVISYDVLGDVVCGGFAIPMRKHYVDKICIVTSADYMSLYAANNILNGIKNYQSSKNPLIGILIGNKINSESEKEIVEIFSKYTNIDIASLIKEDFSFKISDFERKLILESDKFVNSEKEILDLANKIDFIDNKNNNLMPMTEEELETFREEICRRMLK